MTKGVFDFESGENEVTSAVGTITAVYGQAGAGKSTFALSASKNHKILYIDNDNTYHRTALSMGKTGMKDLINKSNISVWSNPTYNKIMELLRSDEISNFDLIVIDSLSMLADTIYREASEVEAKQAKKAKRKVNGQAVYGVVGEKQKNLINICNERGLSVMFVLHEKEAIDEEAGYRLISPALVGQMIMPVFKRVCDNILYLRKIENNEKEIIREVISEADERILVKKKDYGIPDSFKGDDVNYEYLSKFLPNKGLLSDKKKREKKEKEENKKDAIDSIGKASNMDELISIWTAITGAIKIIEGDGVAEAKNKKKKSLKIETRKAQNKKEKEENEKIITKGINDRK